MRSVATRTGGRSERDAFQTRNAIEVTSVARADRVAKFQAHVPMIRSASGRLIP